MENSIEQENDKTTPTSVTVPWWQQPAPRLHGTDSDDHITSVTNQNFGLGVNMTCFLSPTRVVMESFTKDDKDEYKKRFITLQRILSLKLILTHSSCNSPYVNPKFTCTLLISGRLTLP